MPTRTQIKRLLPERALRALRAYHSARRYRDRAVARVVPQRALRAYRGARGRWDANDPLFGAGARQGPLAELYSQVMPLPGYFTYDDAVAFTLVLPTQSATGLRGDVLEIGSYHGRSTVFLARCVEAPERLIVCDTFEASTEDFYPEPPSATILRRNLNRLAPNAVGDQLDIREGRSDTLELNGTRLRFAHVDGGHNHEVALNDLRLVAPHVAPGGVVVVDDYGHPRWPGVATAVDAFLQEASDFSVLADVNRWTEPGRKLYLKRR